MEQNEKPKSLILPLGSSAEEYLQDESRYEGMAYTISFPETEEQVAQVVRTCVNSQESITIQGALTGITGAAVPVGGHVMNLKQMNRCLEILEMDGQYFARAETGITLEDLEKEIRKKTNDRYCFPVLPTEKTATIGGAIASGANGIQSYYYGDIKQYIEEIRICDSTGSTMTLAAQELEPYIRSEGMLGVMTQVMLRLVEKPLHLWGILFLFSNDRQACTFADRIEGEEQVATVEYMDLNSIEIIRKYQPHMSAIAELPEIPSEISALIYVEIVGSEGSQVEECVEGLIEHCVESGGDPEIAWAMTGETEMEPIRAYRHAASECVNMEISANHEIDKRIKKLSVDIKWHHKPRYEILTTYRCDLEESGLSYCIFGHLGTKQPYVNIIAENGAQYQKGKELIKKWIAIAYEERGEVFREHGVGKLKKEYFCEFAPIEEMNNRLKAKAKWDPRGLFNPENMFQERVL